LSQKEINSNLKGLLILPEKRDISSPVYYSRFNGVQLNIPIYLYVSTPGYKAPNSVG